VTTSSKRKRLVCDIDGVLRVESPTFDKPLAPAIQSEINILNAVYDSGWHVTLHTACGWAELLTLEDWLKRHGVKYHVLICGKPICDVLIDDRSYVSLAEAKECGKLE